MHLNPAFRQKAQSMNIWRLNVRLTQIGECVHSRKFAISRRPRNPEIRKGDILLLQLGSSDARRAGKENSRIEFALIFDRYEEDYSGEISLHYWPAAGRTWQWIMHCGDIIPTLPFSLENLPLARSYAGQTNPLRISDGDAARVMPYILRYEETPAGVERIRRVIRETNPSDYGLWAFIGNNDRIVESAPDEIRWETVPERKQIKRNPEIPVILKELYNHTCQVCEQSFEEKYGAAYSETHHIIWLSRGGVDHSNNLLVVCPDHHRIIHETSPAFDRRELSFKYPNGLRERLRLTNHLKDPAMYEKIRSWADSRAGIISRERA